MAAAFRVSESATSGILCLRTDEVNFCKGIRLTSDSADEADKPRDSDPIRIQAEV